MRISVGLTTPTFSHSSSCMKKTPDLREFVPKAIGHSSLFLGSPLARRPPTPTISTVEIRRAAPQGRPAAELSERNAVAMPVPAFVQPELAVAVSKRLIRYV